MKIEKLLSDAVAKKAKLLDALKVKADEMEASLDDDTSYETLSKAYGDLEGELEATVASIADLEAKKADMLARAKRVEDMVGGEDADDLHDTVKKGAAVAPAIAKFSHEKGADYAGAVEVRSLIVEHNAKKFGATKADVAASMFPNDKRLSAVVRAPIAVPGTTTVGVGSELVVQQDAQNELITLLRNALIYTQIPGMRTLPLDPRKGSIRIPRQTGAVAAQWVGEGQSIPVGVPSLDSITINPYKLGVITLSTRELLERSDPAYEMMLRDEVIQGIAQALDTTFMSAAAATATSPAGLLNGLVANAVTMPAAPTAAQAEAVFIALQLALAQANLPGPFVWVMSVRTMYGLMALRSAIDTPLYPELAAGQLKGFPVITSMNVPTNLLGGGEAPLILMKAPELFFGLGEGIRLASSDSAYISSDNAPATPPVAGVSLFQQEMAAIRATLDTTWARRRDAAVSYTTSLL